MTDIAHNAAMLGIQFDSARLFDAGADDAYPLWLDGVTDRVIATKTAIAEQLKADAKG